MSQTTFAERLVPDDTVVTNYGWDEDELAQLETYGTSLPPFSRGEQTRMATLAVKARSIATTDTGLAPTYAHDASAPSATVARSGRLRGRPRKPTDETPVDPSKFDAVVAAIKTIPPDAKDGPPGRNQIRDQTRATVGCDARLPRSAIVVFDRILEQVIWEKGLCRRPLTWFEKNCQMQRNTVSRALNTLVRCGYILRRRKPSAAGDWDYSETTIPALVTALQKVNGEVVPNKLGGSAEKLGGWFQENAGGSAELGLLTSVFPSTQKDDDGGCARARATPKGDAINDLLRGSPLSTPELGARSLPLEGVTEEQCETFRQLADTFGRSEKAIPIRATGRADSDPVLAGLVRSELAGFPDDIVTRAVTAALISATAAQYSNRQEGSAGKGRGGLPSLVRFVLKALRPTAEDMMRAANATEAGNRTEHVVQQEVLQRRVQAVRGGTKQRTRMSSDDVMTAAFGSSI